MSVVQVKEVACRVLEGGTGTIKPLAIKVDNSDDLLNLSDRMYF